MTDILDEAIYDYKEEKKLKRLKHFLIFMLFLTIFGIIALIISNYYTNKSKKHIQEYTQILFELSSDDSKSQDIDNTFTSLINQPNKNIKQIALLDWESRLIKENDLTEAIKKLDLIINGGYSKLATNFALLSKFGIILDKSTIQKLDQNEEDFANNFLENFNDQSEIFHNKASLYKALWYINKGNNIKAKEILNNLKKSDNIGQMDFINANCILSNLEVELSKVQIIK